LAQKTTWNGAPLTETDINTYLMGEGGAWTSWTPTCVQSFPVSLSVTRARFGRWGRKIEFYAYGSFTSNGSNGNEIIFTLPVAAAGSGYLIPSSGFIFDASVPITHVGGVWLKSATTCGIYINGSPGPLAGAGVMTVAAVSGDLWSIAGTYEAAA
jgi:hypothetical protein